MDVSCYLLYLYDLDPKQTTIYSIFELVKHATNITLTHKPEIWQGHSNYFWTARIKLDNLEELNLAAKTLRHYKYGG